MSVTTIREFCPACAAKHLGQARALLLEREKGYPHHVYYALGHMAEAEDEIIERMPEEARLIRTARTALAADIKSNVEFEPLFTAVIVGGLLPGYEELEKRGGTI